MRLPAPPKQHKESFVPTLDNVACASLMEDLTAISARAAQAIKDCAGQSVVRSKADGSPVTAADEAAEAVIRTALAQFVPSVPIISEERAAREKPIVPSDPKADYFLVDPLDGTREFIAGRDEYTINIALMRGGAPILGIIMAPACGLIWRGVVGRGAERLAHTDGKAWSKSPIRARPRPQREVVLVSRSHLDAQTRIYLDGLPQADLVQSGSSIKFCRLAEGSADRYPRLAPTRDWDIAAGHAILEAAGGTVTAPDGSPLVYGSHDLLIPAFLALGAPATA
jgi:3'(2'), 5'-bisphosphate nucleotidase